MKKLGVNLRLLVLGAMVGWAVCGQAGAQAGTVPTAAPQAAAPAAKKLQFFVKLIPPRPTFATDFTEKEGEIMGRHAAYWAEFAKTGQLLILGPVLDPKGAFGIAVIEVGSEAEAREIANGDPSVKEGLNTITVAPMRVAMRKKD